ncbi:tyrosine phosphatase family protein [Hansschlegelia quercus]|uniref:Protein tyrosine phosphatase n=1 Tax=Hansschlegelia quercus TaxID=2528245 RepID=A0A4Q9GKH4_9HYPH|nr:protein-tyrosine phosphatase family protein [Hansschlegelia quercus]TBN54698.1 protein tyrosine phosphatase [Hansschlegelia quercus]
MTIGVCPLSRLEETVAATGAARVLSLLSDGTDAATPAGIEPANHLVLRFHDLVEPLVGHVHPRESHIAEALTFAAEDDGPIVVHCYAGISRSTAMAFAIACARRPGRDEAEIARALREASPTATPNRLIVALVDKALGRNGRMVAAIDAIGRGADAFEGRPFVLREQR